MGIGIYTFDEAIEWGVTGPDYGRAGLNGISVKEQPLFGVDENF